MILQIYQIQNGFVLVFQLLRFGYKKYLGQYCSQREESLFYSRNFSSAQ